MSFLHVRKAPLQLFLTKFAYAILKRKESGLGVLGMPLTEREKKVYQDILNWQDQFNQFESNDFALTFDKYLERSFSVMSEDVQAQIYTILDNWLFHLHSFIQGSQIQQDAKERILLAGRVFHPEITRIDQLQNLSIDQLQYIAEQQISRHRMYSFIQGGLSGTGGAVLLGSDLPAMAVINLRIVQLIAMTYGYEVNTPYEMMTSLKVFHGATMPVRIQKKKWEELWLDYENAKGNYFYEGIDEVTDITWMEQPIKQLLKAMAIVLLKRKTIGNIPLMSIAIGAGSNYQLTRKVTEFAHKYYQMRYLEGKRENGI